MQLDVAVGEEDKRRRGDGGLGHVIDFDAAVHGDRGALEVDGGEEAVHRTGGDALAALAGDELDFAEELLDAEAGGGGDEDEWGVVEELEVCCVTCCSKRAGGRREGGCTLYVVRCQLMACAGDEGPTC